jgi:CheY-like chemotaxis protein
MAAQLGSVGERSVWCSADRMTGGFFVWPCACCYGPRRLPLAGSYTKRGSTLFGTLFAGLAPGKKMKRPARVLIVDDDETFCQFLAEVLDGRGINVVWTTDGLKGYETSLYEPYDLFILDQRMPLILGTELVEELKKDNPRAKIILTSAFADDALRTRMHSLGVPLLSKPFSANRLLQVVESVLGWSKHDKS